MGKQKSPHGISPGLFCFPMGKQKSPSDALSLQWYYKQFEMGKQKSPGGLPLGLFCFPKIIQTINDLIFISRWVINKNTGNEEVQILCYIFWKVLSLLPQKKLLAI